MARRHFTTILLLFFTMLAGLGCATETPALSPSLTFGWWNRKDQARPAGSKEPRLELEGATWFDRHEAAVFRGGEGRLDWDSVALVRVAAQKTGVLALECVVTLHGPSAEACSFLTIEQKDGSELLRVVQKDLTLTLVSGSQAKDLGTLKPSEPAHLVVCVSAGQARAWLNGAVVVEELAGTALGEISNVRFGPKPKTKETAWQGTLLDLAVAHEAPSNEAVKARYEKLLALWHARQPVETLAVQAKLLDLAEANPDGDAYPRGLFCFHYEVEKVLTGKTDAKKLQVYHWGVLGYSNQAVLDREPGQSYTLNLTPLAAAPYLKEIERADGDHYDENLQDWYDPGF